MPYAVQPHQLVQRGSELLPDVRGDGHQLVVDRSLGGSWLAGGWALRYKQGLSISTRSTSKLLQARFDDQTPYIYLACMGQAPPF
jgi:hypothetical protein